MARRPAISRRLGEIAAVFRRVAEILNGVDLVGQVATSPTAPSAEERYRCSPSLSLKPKFDGANVLLGKAAHDHPRCHRPQAPRATTVHSSLLSPIDSVDLFVGGRRGLFPGIHKGAYIPSTYTNATTIEGAAAEAGTQIANWYAADADDQRPQSHAIYLYNAAQDQGYLAMDMDLDGSYETGVIFVGVSVEEFDDHVVIFDADLI